MGEDARRESGLDRARALRLTVAPTSVLGVAIRVRSRRSGTRAGRPAPGSVCREAVWPRGAPWRRDGRSSSSASSARTRSLCRAAPWTHRERTTPWRTPYPDQKIEPHTALPLADAAPNQVKGNSRAVTHAVGGRCDRGRGTVRRCAGENVRGSPGGRSAGRWSSGLDIRTDTPPVSERIHAPRRDGTGGEGS